MAVKVVPIRADHILGETVEEWMARMKAKWLAEDSAFFSRWHTGDHMAAVEKVLTDAR